MSWFDTAGLTTLAKTALKEAQKTIDKALDIQEEESDSPELKSKENAPKSDFFSSWGLTMSGESENEGCINDLPIITESPSKSHTLWGSFAGSFFDTPKQDIATVDIQDIKNMTCNFADASSDEQRSQNIDKRTEIIDEIKVDDTAIKEAALKRLSIISSENGSESVEVLGSHKTTPDSELTPTLSHSSSSLGLKHNSESVVILPDSLISSSSIEYLGSNSKSSEKSQEEISSSKTSPDDDWSNRQTDLAEDMLVQIKSNDSVSLVVEDDDDTISYNSESECTAPTVLDTDEPPISRQPTRSDSLKYKKSESRDFQAEKVHSNVMKSLERANESYASSDGSWSDKTLVVDDSKESIVDCYIEEKEKTECTTTHSDGDKNSDTSSYCNVTAQSDMCSSTSDQTSVSGFITVQKEKKVPSSEAASSHKESSRDGGSPLSSESCSGLVKVGSDRTSGHTSGDDLETATSSDIEVIPSPNSEQNYRHTDRGKADRATSPNLVDFVLEKSLITKIRGHNRELSETSVISQGSEDSGSENEKLFKRLCEMAEILQARELKIIELSKQNLELSESNEEYKTRIANLTCRQEVGDLTEDYNMRLSALEKKFQQTLREKDALTKQVDDLKSNTAFQKEIGQLSSELNEKDEMIKQMHEEGDQLTKQHLVQSNIIKKLRTKDKENEQLVKGLRDRIAEQMQELDRLKRTLISKDEIEMAQVEAVYKLTNINKKLEADLAETKSSLDDTTQKLSTCKTSLEAARRELTELAKDSNSYKKKRDALASIEQEKEKLENENEQLKQQMENLRAKFIQEESRWARREANLRSELADARALCSGDEESTENASALVQQLHALQYSALERDKQHRAHSDKLTKALQEAQFKLSKCADVEKGLREEIDRLHSRLEMSEHHEKRVGEELKSIKTENEKFFKEIRSMEEELNLVSSQLEQLKFDSSTNIHNLREHLKKTEGLLNQERSACEAERRKNAFLQEQLSSRYDRSQGHSPPVSISASDSASLPWQQDEALEHLGHHTSYVGSNSIAAIDNLASRLARREGELKTSCARIKELQREKDALTAELAKATHQLQQLQSVREQYEALLVLYGERAEQAAELGLDLQDVKDLYKSQLDEIISLKRQLADKM